MTEGRGGQVQGRLPGAAPRTPIPRAQVSEKVFSLGAEEGEAMYVVRVLPGAILIKAP